ncbi:MAG TPA: alkaline shock response membrane anchor protein AmaP [Candidatus Omnitrophica bacterium]|nr:alkaline shock response membrane anchor protein AmaP [Candidatus Omnitrophota bacterium]
MNFLTVLVYCLISLFLGVSFLGFALNLIDLNLITEYLEKNILLDPYSRIILGLIGILILLFCLRCLQLIFYRLTKEKSINFSSEHGEVSVIVSAIEDLIKKLLEEKKEFSHIKPKVILRKKGIEIIIRGDLASEVNIVEFTKEVQEKVKDKLYAFLGEEKVINVRVEIRKIVFAGKKKEGEEEEKELEIPFRNY